jgi:hypothetical protein
MLRSPSNIRFQLACAVDAMRIAMRYDNVVGDDPVGKQR